MQIQFDSIEHIEASGVPIAFRKTGSGDLLMLFHGGSGSYTHWLRNIPALSQHFQVGVPDLPGFGDSGDVPQGIEAARYADIVAEFAQMAVAPGAAFHLAGFSFGGMNAAAVAARLPGRVKRLSILSPGGFGPIHSASVNLKKRSRSMTNEELREVYRHNLLAMMIHGPGNISEETVTVYQGNLEAARFRNQYLSREDSLMGYLAQLEPGLPVQFIYGEFDHLALPTVQARLERIKSVLPEAETHVIPKAGHWSLYETAEAVNSLLLRFHSATGAYGTADPVGAADTAR